MIFDKQVRTVRQVTLYTIVGLALCFAQIARSAESATSDTQSVPAANQCLSRTELSRNMTPVVLDSALVSCVNASRLDDAVFLFALGGVFGRYDALRVSDQTAGQAVKIVRMHAMQSMSGDKREIFEEHLKSIMAIAPDSARLCAWVRNLGAPTYYPAYMIGHGLAAMQADMSGKLLADKGLRSGFDEAQGWNDALEGYLQCG